MSTNPRVIGTAGGDLSGSFVDPVVISVAHVTGGVLSIANGGTGLSSTPTNGQLLIGSGSSYSLATLTAGDNVTIVTGSGTIIISASGGGGGGSGDIEAVNAGTNLTGGGLSGSVTLNLADNINLSTVTASFSGSGANITSITSSNITNFTTDVRGQLSAGSNLSYSSGQFALSANPSVTTITASTGFSGGSFTGTTVSASSAVTTPEINTNYIDFQSASAPAALEGRVYYDTDALSLTEYTDQSTTVNLGKQLVLRVRNSTGGTLSKGKIVRITGATGNTPTVNTASWDNDSTSANTLAMVMADILDTNFGYVLLTGVLKGVNTNGYTSGQMLYLSSSGNYTNVVPSVPYHEVRIGQVLDVGTQGSLFVRIQNGYELNELHDVDAASPAYGDLLSWTSNGGNDQWRNTKQLTGSYGLTGSLSATGQISGSTFVGNGASITSITASNITNFTTDVRAQFTAGTNITIVDGVISSTGGGGSSGVTAITSSNSNLTFSPTSGSVTGSLSANLSVTSVTASSGFSGNLTGVATTARYGISQFTVASTSGLTTGSLVYLASGTNSPLAIATKTTDSGSNAIGIIDAINGTTVDVMWAGERLINENVSAQTIGTPLYVGNSGATALYSAISAGEYATKVGFVSVTGSGAGSGKMFIQIHPFGQIN
jgi:hypothetical protein